MKKNVLVFLATYPQAPIRECEGNLPLSTKKIFTELSITELSAGVYNVDPKLVVTA